jgi:hypothetical protein
MISPWRCRLGSILLVLIILLAPALASADTFSGFLNDPGNVVLVASDLGPALFGDDFEIANNVALHTLLVAVADTYSFESTGFAAGGVDPYFTLFDGTNPAGTFVGSNYATAFSTGGDFTLSFSLNPGTYTLAVGAFANLSFSENLGTGTLGDGFTGLGGPGFLGTSFYEIQVAQATTPPVPAPATVFLLVSGLAAVAAWARARR